jgi:hypothetical protein
MQIAEKYHNYFLRYLTKAFILCVHTHCLCKINYTEFHVLILAYRFNVTNNPILYTSFLSFKYQVLVYTLPYLTLL